jgi:two-component system nitrate/nitrite response regulator NarL
VVGEATDGDEAITQTLELEPDILLLDVQMPRLPGLEAMRAIMNGTPTVKILLLTSTITTQQIIEALHIGARGIVLKDALASHLQTAIRTVFSGDYWIGGKRVVNLVSALHDLMQQAAVPQRKTYGLTPRELEVVGCIVEGCSNRDIAKQFTLSEETVKRHLSNIFDKTGVSTRLELALFAIAHLRRGIAWAQPRASHRQDQRGAAIAQPFELRGNRVRIVSQQPGLNLRLRPPLAQQRRHRRPGGILLQSVRATVGDGEHRKTHEAIVAASGNFGMEVHRKRALTKLVDDTGLSSPVAP